MKYKMCFLFLLVFIPLKGVEEPKFNTIVGEYNIKVIDGSFGTLFSETKKAYLSISEDKTMFIFSSTSSSGYSLEVVFNQETSFKDPNIMEEIVNRTKQDQERLKNRAKIMKEKREKNDKE